MTTLTPWPGDPDPGDSDELDDYDPAGEIDDGYDLDDPKHPTFRDRHADLWDMREGK